MSVRELACALWLTTVLTGQDPAAAGTRVSVATWSAEQSRSLFRGCDRNADDRIDLFEAMAAIEVVDGREAFRRLDKDRDGYLDWPEFDQFFRNQVRAGDALRLRPLRATPTATNTARDTAPRTPIQQTIALFDLDRSGALESAEIDALLREFKLPAEAAPQVRALDRDHDGKVDERELAPIMPQLQLVSMFTERLQKPPGKSTLPAPWDEIDRNGNGKVEAAELEAAIRRVDPSLARWSGSIVKAADRNGDGTLGADELAPAPAGAATAVKAVVERSDKR